VTAKREDETNSFESIGKERTAPTTGTFVKIGEERG
jgi:hypothetical protein